MTRTYRPRHLVILQVLFLRPGFIIVSSAMTPDEFCSANTRSLQTEQNCTQGTVFVPHASFGTCTPCTSANATKLGYTALGHWCPGYEGAKKLREEDGVRNEVDVLASWRPLCRNGYVCESVLEEKICPEDSYCREGFAEPLFCGLLAGCKAGSHAEELNSMFGVAMVGFVIGLVILWLLTWHYRNIKATAATRRLDQRKLRDDALNALLEQVCGKSQRTMDLHGFGNTMKPVNVTFENISLILKSNGLKVLDNVTGELPAGSFAAVMGPSGGGKTSFLNAISGRAYYGVVAGNISVNGQHNAVSMFPTLVGFVPQDDIIHDTLTVYQNLYYSAMLRLPASMSHDQKLRIIDDVLLVLELEHIKDRVVGAPGSARRISGGQKKRVNIGMELVIYPRILFMDEPTTGLDSTAALQVARCLQRLGEIGITVVCVIHQPRFSVFQTFSQVMLLAPGGRTVYVGKADSMMEYFLRQGFRLPKGENVADWFVDIIGGHVPRYFESGVIDKDFKVADLLNMWNLEIASPGRDVPGGLTRRESVNRLYDLLPRHPRKRFQGSPILNTPSCVQEIQDFFVELWTNQSDGSRGSGSDPKKRRRATRLRGKKLDIMLKKNVSLEDFLSFAHHYLVDASVETWMMVLQDIGGDATGIPLQTLLAYFRNQVDRVTSNVQQVNLEVQNDEKSEVLRQRVTPNFFVQLKIFLSRDIHKFSLVLLLFTVFLTLIFSILTGMSLHNKFEYKDIVLRQFRPVTLLCILTSATQLTLFGNERLIFKREISTGISALAYWAAKNIWGLVDLVAISFIFTLPWVYLTSADFGLLKGFAVCLLLSWSSQGFGFLVSVGFKDSRSLAG
eukprot:GEMP01006699.1.p1 GENE.GEMP01006699.1~~GEMP01006699.1.p1  ORF type:complete len:846 (+),score=147.35 GEMP01006699.1:213-2750(+)